MYFPVRIKTDFVRPIQTRIYGDDMGKILWCARLKGGRILATNVTPRRSGLFRVKRLFQKVDKVALIGVNVSGNYK